MKHPVEQSDPQHSLIAAVHFSRNTRSCFYLGILPVVLVAGIVATSAASAAGFLPAAPMNTPRVEATATLLLNGKVLVAGGQQVPGVLASAELYDPARNTWGPAGSLAVARLSATATMLPNGKVLVAGGRDGSGNLASAELYDPTSDAWSSAGDLAAARSFATATLLPGGNVLVAGGNFLASAELYDPATNAWSAAGPLAHGRQHASAALLLNGKVFVTGGNTGPPMAELYDPATNTWSMAANPPVGGGTATLLPNGKVLVAFGDVAGSAHLYDPVTDTWSSGGTPTVHGGYEMAGLLPNGQVLFAGGFGSVLPTTSAQLYDSASNTWSAAGNRINRLGAYMAMLLPSGKLFLVGGSGGGGASAAAELYDPTAPAWTSGGSLVLGRELATATLLPSGKVLVAAGQVTVGGPNPIVNSAELYDPVSNAWSSAGNLAIARRLATATLLSNGKVLVAGGETNNGGGFPVMVASAELYDPTTNGWTSAASMSAIRSEATATLLTNGKVLVAGGWPPAVSTAAEVYDPISNNWSPAAPMTTAHLNGTATLLPSGKVLVAGGWDTSFPIFVTTPSAELYDPANNTWSPAGALNIGRGSATATLLPNGNVLVAGGYSDSLGSLDSAEIYNPVTNGWSVGPSPGVVRDHGVATLLPNGNVLVAGGGQTVNGNPISATSLYDSTRNIWVLAPPLAAARANATSTLLPDGRVLVVGGVGTGFFFLASSELFDLGLAFADSRRPVVSSATDPLLTDSTLALTGNLFRGDTEASNGSFSSSPTNYPLVQLRRIDNEQLHWIDPAASSPFTASAWISAGVSGLQPGPHLVTMFVNGIPSVSRMISVTPGISPILLGAVSRRVHGSAGTFDLPLSLVVSPYVNHNPTTEPRAGPAQTIVLTFDRPIVGATATITEGTATAAAPTFGANDVIVDLTGVINQQYVSVFLTNISAADGGAGEDRSIRLGFLVGDVNQNRVVTVADLGLVNAQLAQTVTGANYLKDLNASGALSVADKGMTNANLTKALPAP